MNKFKPKMYCKNIHDINYGLLKEKGIKVLIFDLDNTTVGVDEVVPNEKVVLLIQKLKSDFKVFIASNNSKKRVRKIGEHLGIHGFYSVFKPTKKIRKLLLKKYEVKMEEAAIIGDQIITDILMGNRLKMLTVLVDPISNKDLKVTYFNRWLEKMIMKVMKFQRGEYYE